MSRYLGYVGGGSKIKSKLKSVNEVKKLNNLLFYIKYEVDVVLNKNGNDTTFTLRSENVEVVILIPQVFYKQFLFFL